MIHASRELPLALTMQTRLVVSTIKPMTVSRPVSVTSTMGALASPTAMGSRPTALGARDVPAWPRERQMSGADPSAPSVTGKARNNEVNSAAFTPSTTCAGSSAYRAAPNS
jgi:hypothetical protein